MLEKLFNTREVAEILGVHINTVWTYILSGKLKASKLGGNHKPNPHKQWRVKESDLNAFINGQSAEPRHTEPQNEK